MASKELRRYLVETREPASKHSLNQHRLHYVMEQEAKFFGTVSKKMHRSVRNRAISREPMPETLNLATEDSFLDPTLY